MKSLETNYLGRKYLEQFTKITVKSVFTKVENHLREELLNIELEGIELVYSKANYGGNRAWFKCPYCKESVFTLYNISGELQCRKCSGLPYKKQRYKGMIEDKIYN